jgi:hypothetical protein
VCAAPAPAPNKHMEGVTAVPLQLRLPHFSYAYARRGEERRGDDGWMDGWMDEVVVRVY